MKRKSKFERLVILKNMSQAVADRCKIPTVSKEVFRGKTTYKEDGTPVLRQITHDFGVSNTYPQEKWIEAGGIKVIEKGSGKGNDKVQWIAEYPPTDEFVKKLERLCGKHRKILNDKYDRKRKKNLINLQPTVNNVEPATTNELISEVATNDLYAIPTEAEIKSSKVQNDTVEAVYSAIAYASVVSKNVYLPKENLFTWYEKKENGEMVGVNLLENAMHSATRFSPEFLVKLGYFLQRGKRGSREFMYAKDTPFTKEDAKMILVIYNRVKSTPVRKKEEPVIPVVNEVAEIHEPIANSTPEPIQSMITSEQYAELISNQVKILANQTEILSNQSKMLGSQNEFMDKIHNIVLNALGVSEVQQNTKEFIIEKNSTTDADKK